jgi:hypothetical protein
MLWDTKKRLQERLAISDENLAQYRFALIPEYGQGTARRPVYVDDGRSSCPSYRWVRILTNLQDDALSDLLHASEKVLGLDHPPVNMHN